MTSIQLFILVHRIRTAPWQWRVELQSQNVPNLVAFRHKKKQRFGTSNSRRLQDLERQAARQIEDVVLALATAALAISTGAAAAASMKCWVFYRFST